MHWLHCARSSGRPPDEDDYMSFSPNHTLRRLVDAARAPVTLGVGSGLLAAVIWASYLAFARAGTTAGLRPEDFALLRYGTAGLVLLPVLLARGRPANGNGPGWRRSLVLTLCAGPLFILCGAAGFTFAPLAHGAIIQPSAMSLVTMALSSLVLGDRPTRARMLGTAVIFAGLVLITAAGLGGSGAEAWIGDLLFVMAGALWAVFSVLVKRWKIEPLHATAIVSVLSGAVVVPAHAFLAGADRLLALGLQTMTLQILVQGILSGVVAVLAFAKAVENLGASRASIFAALVPAFAVLAGIPITGELPTVAQLGGLAIVSLGLLIAIGAVSLPRPRRVELCRG